MPGRQRESAIIVRVALPRGLERLRRVGTRVAALGAPAHVTVLYPFVPEEALDPSRSRRSPRGSRSSAARARWR